MLAGKDADVVTETRCDKVASALPLAQLSPTKQFLAAHTHLPALANCSNLLGQISKQAGKLPLVSWSSFL